MNCLEWLPTYFGILRTGGWAVPLNFRFVAKTIYNCTKLAEPRVFIFGEEFIDRINEIRYDIQGWVKSFIFVGPEDKCPEWAESLSKLIQEYPRCLFVYSAPLSHRGEDALVWKFYCWW